MDENSTNQINPEAPDPVTEAVKRGLALFDSGGGELVKILAQSGNYDKRGHGSAESRRVILPGETTSRWANEAGETDGDYDRRTKNGTDYSWVPEGTIVVAYDTETTKFGKGRAKLTAGVVVKYRNAEGKDRTVAWESSGLTARRKGDAVIVTLPDGRKLTF
jgi:hypothetical protein